MRQLVPLFLDGLILTVFQLAAAAPWLLVVSRRGLKSWLRSQSGVNILFAAVAGLVGVAVLAAAFGFFLWVVQDAEQLTFWGRVYGSILQAQLTVDFFIVALVVLLRLWPKGGAVALAAFREALRQPMFWTLVGVAVLL